MVNASHVEPRRDGAAIIAPKRAEGPDGLVGIGWVRLEPGDPEYRMWDEYLRATGSTGPRRPGGTPQVGGR